MGTPEKRQNMEFYRKVVDVTETAMRSKNLRVTSRVFMASAFIEDGIRMIRAPSEIASVVEYNTSTPHFVSYILTLINGFLSLFGAMCLIAGAKQREGCIMLLTTLLLQFWLFDLLHDDIVLPKACSIAGSIGLCICETLQTSRQVFAGLPELTEKLNSAEYIKLMSRIAVTLMYLSGFSMSVYSFATLPMILAVFIGYQTKFAAGLFIAFSMTDNIIFNAFWMHWGTYVFEIMKFDFFQQLSSIGGVMQLLIYGGGKLSLDAKLKDR